MIDAFITAVGVIMGVGSIVVGVWTLIEHLRSREATPEEQGRAQMRSLSWPSKQQAERRSD